jgi:hypothetical protein
MKEICDDPNCPEYGQPLTDRGYGYPVCPSNRWYSERFPGSKNKLMIEVSPEIIQQSAQTAAAYVDLSAWRT